MKHAWATFKKQLAMGVISGALLFADTVAAEDNWGFDLEAYGWLLIIEFETEDGVQDKITRDDLLKDLDMTAMWAAKVRKGRWSLASDFIYFKVSNKQDLALISNLPSLATLKKAGLQAWIVTPNAGYTLLDNDKHKMDLFAGARYIWIEVDATIETNPILPGQPTTNQQASPSDSNWDAIAGVRGSYQLADKWFVPYVLDAGTGDSDFVWGAQTALGYRFNKLDAIAGWRYLSYDLGSDTTLKELTVNGPFVGAIFHW